MTRHISILMSGILAGLALNAQSIQAQIPEILEIGEAEHLHSTPFQRCAIATDSRNQPHIVIGAFTKRLGLFDKVNDQWQLAVCEISQYNPYTQNTFNPTIGIDTTTDTAWIGAVMFTCCVPDACGLGIIVRENVATSPGPIHFSRNVISPLDWEPSMLRIDPTRPGIAVGHSYEGYWAEYQYDASRPDRKKRIRTGRLFAGHGGEKNSFAISKAGVWHGACGGYSAWSSSYQNSVRQAQRKNPVTFASYSRYSVQGHDEVYIGLGTDNANGEAAYIACDFLKQAGICVNIWNGERMMFPTTRLLAVDPKGTSGSSRFSPQWAPAKDGGGAFLVWSRSNRVKIRYIPLTATSLSDCGPEVDIGPGSRANICTDSDGNLHLVYNYYGVKYRKLYISGATPSIQASSKAADFDGDGLDDIAVFRASTGEWIINQSTGSTVTNILGQTGDIPLPADYNGDGYAEAAVYRPTNNTWYVLSGTTIVHGTEGDIPVPADYNGDGATDFAVFRPSEGYWYIYGDTAYPLGEEGDTPVPCDYDGDGTDNRVVYRPSTGTWILQNENEINLGGATDIPLPADYDGDGQDDLAVFTPDDGIWSIIGTQAGAYEQYWGTSTDIPVPGRLHLDKRS